MYEVEVKIYPCSLKLTVGEQFLFTKSVDTQANILLTVALGP